MNFNPLRLLLFLHFILATLTATFLKAQVKSEASINSEIKKLEKNLIYSFNLDIDKDEQSDLSLAKTLFDQSAEIDTLLISAIDKSSYAEVNALKKNIGLDFNTSYIENLRPGSDQDENQVYVQRLQTGIDWSMLGNNGYLANQLKLKQVKNEYTIEKLKLYVDELHRNNFNSYALIKYIFNNSRTKLLEVKKTVDSENLKIITELNRLKQVPYLQVLKVAQAVTDAVNSLKNIKVYNDLIKSQLNVSHTLSTKALPQLNVNVNKLLELNNAHRLADIKDSIAMLMIDNFTMSSRLVNRLDFRASVKYNYFDMFNKPYDRTFVSVGLGIVVPLPLGIKANQKAMAAKSIFLSRNALSKDYSTADIINQVGDYNNKTNEYTDLYNLALEYKEQLRIESVKQQYGNPEFNPIGTITFFDEYLDTKLKMIDIQEELYLQLLQLQVFYPNVKLSSCISPTDNKPIIAQQSTTEHKLKKAVYIWSSAFEELSNPAIKQLMLDNNFSMAIISGKKDETTFKKSLQLADTLTKYKISTQLLVGNNKLINYSDPVPYIDSIVSTIGNTHFTGLHLDVEPHTFPDWEGKKEFYMLSYISMLKAVKKYCSSKGLQLAVSIPVNYKPEYLKSIYELCDEVYLMAYEHVDVDYIARKTQEEFALGKEKTIVAVRTNDFNSQKELNNFIDELSKKLLTDKIAVHDLTRLNKLKKE